MKSSSVSVAVPPTMAVVAWRRHSGTDFPSIRPVAPCGSCGRPIDRAEQAIFQVACDVSNPLLGELGCTRVYGPQKGSARAELARHEQRLAELAEAVVTRSDTHPVRFARGWRSGRPGIRPDGFLRRRIAPGIRPDRRAIWAGGRDRQSRPSDHRRGKHGRANTDGKGPAGVAEMARSAGTRVIALCGIARDREALGRQFDEVISLESLTDSREESINCARELLEKAAAGLKI